MSFMTQTQIAAIYGIDPYAEAKQVFIKIGLRNSDGSVSATHLMSGHCLMQPSKKSATQVQLWNPDAVFPLLEAHGYSRCSDDDANAILCQIDQARHVDTLLNDLAEQEKTVTTIKMQLDELSDIPATAIQTARIKRLKEITGLAVNANLNIVTAEQEIKKLDAAVPCTDPQFKKLQYLFKTAKEQYRKLHSKGYSFSLKSKPPFKAVDSIIKALERVSQVPKMKPGNISASDHNVLQADVVLIKRYIPAFPPAHKWLQQSQP